MLDLIFSEGDFALYKREGVGQNDTHYEGLEVKSSDNAVKYVVEVRLYSIGYPSFDGTPVKYRYDTERTEVSHGMSMKAESLAETAEYIEVLQAAIAFANRVNKWIVDNGWD